MAAAKLGLALFVGVTIASSAEAQKPFVFLGGGATVPVSVYKNEDGAKTGWMATAGIGFPVGDKPVSVGGELMFGSNKHEAPPEGDKTNLLGAAGFVSARLGNAEKPYPYLIGSLGMLKHDYRSTAFPDEQGGDFAVTWSAGAGLAIPVGSGGTEVWFEGRFVSRGDTRFIPIFAGFAIPLGR
ncbi:MAG: outer membrane beta-barrel protein [Gemmatimonadales bacterium]